MDLESLQIALRPRTHWESIDLGVLMVRRWWWQLTFAWLLLALPTLALALAVTRSPVWAMLIVWWFKPLYERLPLLVLATTIFGERRTLRDTIADAAYPWRTGLAWSLTFARFGPSRSFHAPLAVLEGLSGDARFERFKLLQRTASGAATWLTVLGIHLETFLSIGAAVLVAALVPTEVEVDIALASFEVSQTALWANVGLSFLAMMLVAPFYVGAGFSLYLNRRVELEAWDLELGFRRLASRAAAAAGTTVVAVGIVVVLAAGQEVSAAQNEEPEYVDTEQLDEIEASRQAIDDVLAGPAFHMEVTRTVPKFLEDFEPDEDDSTDPSDGLAAFFAGLAQLAEVLLWGGLGVLVLWIITHFRAWEYLRRGDRAAQPPLPVTLMGLRVEPDSLPPDVTASASTMWNSGETRDAVSLLYRAALVRLMTSYDCRFKASDTEGQCLAAVHRAGASSAVSGCFDALTATWQRVAYAHVAPSESDFATLIGRWRSVFDETSGQASDDPQGEARA